MTRVTAELLNDLKNYLSTCHLQHAYDDEHHSFGRKHRTSVVSELINSGECPESTGLCQETSIFLKKFFRSHLNEEWRVTGGFSLDLNIKDPKDILKKEFIEKTIKSGNELLFFDNTRLLTSDMKVFGSHWWITKDELIIDLSGDQFGHPGIIVTNIDDERYIDRETPIFDMKNAKKIASIWERKGFNPDNSTMKFHSELVSNYRKILINNRDLISSQNPQKVNLEHLHSIDL